MLHMIKLYLALHFTMKAVCETYHLILSQYGNMSNLRLKTSLQFFEFFHNTLVRSQHKHTELYNNSPDKLAFVWCRWWQKLPTLCFPMCNPKGHIFSDIGEAAMDSFSSPQVVSRTNQTPYLIKPTYGTCDPGSAGKASICKYWSHIILVYLLFSRLLCTQALIDTWLQ